MRSGRSHLLVTLNLRADFCECRTDDKIVEDEAWLLYAQSQMLERHFMDAAIDRHFMVSIWIETIW
jgi:hypothetical protein